MKGFILDREQVAVLVKMLDAVPESSLADLTSVEVYDEPHGVSVGCVTTTTCSLSANFTIAVAPVCGETPP